MTFFQGSQFSQAIRTCFFRQHYLEFSVHTTPEKQENYKLQSRFNKIKLLDFNLFTCKWPKQCFIWKNEKHCFLLISEGKWSTKYTILTLFYLEYYESWSIFLSLRVLLILRYWFRDSLWGTVIYWIRLFWQFLLVLSVFAYKLQLLCFVFLLICCVRCWIYQRKCPSKTRHLKTKCAWKCRKDNRWSPCVI